jgi:hypothetical protein
MKKRITYLLTITIALVLISSLAIASENKKQAQPVALTPESITEEEALIAELLDDSEEHQYKKSGMNDDLKKSYGGKSGVRKDPLKIKIIPKTTYDMNKGLIIVMEAWK